MRRVKIVSTPSGVFMVYIAEWRYETWIHVKTFAAYGMDRVLKSLERRVK